MSGSALPRSHHSRMSARLWPAFWARAVIDVNGYVPRIVRASGELLEPCVGRYVFISSVSVYANLSQPGATENASLIELEDAETGERFLLGAPRGFKQRFHEQWEKRKHDWLPSTADTEYLLSIMDKPVYEPGKFANYIAPPRRGINQQPIDFEYVRTEQ